MSARYAITGGTGCLGRALIRALERTGQLSVLSRTPCGFSESLRGRGHRIVPGDLDDPASLDALVAGSEVVFHCAALLGNGDGRASWRVNVEGTERLAAACARAGVRRMVYVSSISVFSATRRRAPIVESDVPENVGRLCAYSRTKYEGELIAKAVAQRHGLELTIIRPTNVYGPWSQPWFAGWARMIRRLPVAFGNLPIDVVHADDVAEAMMLAGHAPEAAGETIHIGSEVVLLRDFIAGVADVVGRRVYRLPRLIDASLRRVAALAFRLATGTFTAMPLVRPSIYPHGKAVRLLGYAPRVDLVRGLGALRQWYESEPAT
jgi:nucleoside-diphosphate-sugar epimerase